MIPLAHDAPRYASRELLWNRCDAVSGCVIVPAVALSTYSPTPRIAGYGAALKRLHQFMRTAAREKARAATGRIGFFFPFLYGLSALSSHSRATGGSGLSFLRGVGGICSFPSVSFSGIVLKTLWGR